jgi:DNA polymerase III subunit delta
MIIFLYGPDSFRSSQKVLEIRQKFLLIDPVGSGLSVFDYSEKSSKNNFLDVLGIANLLAPKRLVIVKNIISAGTEVEQDSALDYFKKNKYLVEDNDLVVVFWESIQPKKSNALYKFLEKNTKSQNFERLSGAKLASWILKRIKELDDKASISKTALEKLAVYVGDDLFLLDKEIQKLVNYCDGKIIKDEDVDLLVKANLDSNIFATVDALGSRNKSLALKLLHHHLEGGEDPFYLFSMFIYQFRNLLKIADLKENQGAGEYEIAKLAKLHPFVVKKSLAQLRNFSWERLVKIYQKLSNLDTAAKTGKIDIRLALDKFIVEL